MADEAIKENKKPETAEEQKPAPTPAQEKAPETVPEKPKAETPKETATDEPKPQPEEPPKEVGKALVPKRILGIPPDKLKLFDKYDMSNITVTDAGLARYINLDPVIVPHTGARQANRPFAKSKMNIVERLVNNMMRTEAYTGKKTKTYRVVMEAFEIIETKTKKNPVQVFIDALENTTPREEVTRLRYGGVSVPKAVDVSSSRRLDVAIRNICKGAQAASFKSTKPIEICLANEIMLGAKGDMGSFAVAKKEETERVAGSAR